jgi:hypothetical protein
MTIEFYGLPGSGKSTLYKQLTKENVFKFVGVKNKISIITNFFMFTLKHKRYIGLSIIYGLKYRRTTASLWNTCVVRPANYNFAESMTGNDVIILEEGLLQNLLSFAEALQNKSTFEKYFSLTPVSNKIIILNLDENLRSLRLTERNKLRNEENDFSEKGDGAMKIVQQYFLEVIANRKDHLVFSSGEAAGEYLRNYEKTT